ncbi:SIS domain-containing protein [Frankia sp. CNm7]|uniref:SIS domain-containing protein n=1 Tax=Frankia nepalensis TaxID=1836974 RepID=A0A937RGD8_9ACTN|nr:SIS domain-containing protein [Frankia nepalensis]MBL7497815.1 SIS domain-containing protein [Frankia nepalensis]MBL7512655.1 SIS domain-containing protein [Frankia nepalensis]MBL7519130.1 SIS domain-containing protein [Frankia nepalensis]MBL7631716.1 SIS domain-containing protein [Frankia nepalensis]
MNADLFLADLEEKPARLRELAPELAGCWAGVDTKRPTLLLGMGSSHYANGVAAARLRAAGVPAVAELASTDLLPRLAPGTLVIAVSASGGSVETLDAVRRLRAAHPDLALVALTNRDGTELEALCGARVPMLAGDERGGVACRSFQHTLAVLLSLPGGGLDPAAVTRAAEATEDLLARRDAWLPRIGELLLGPDGTHVAAPARRLSSALQSALMLREGPRLAAVGCETGDWSHVDVYLTRTTDYRLLLLAGSRWEPELLRWTTERGSTVVAVGAETLATAHCLRYPGDGDDDVRLLTETLVAELLAAEAWRR